MLLKKILDTISFCELAISEERLGDVSPFIHIDELANKQELQKLESEEPIAQVWMFIEHYFDARSHNFDTVVDGISIEMGLELINQIKMDLRNGDLPKDERLIYFKRYI